MKEIEVIPGLKVKLNEQLMDDVDFVSDLQKAIASNNYAESIEIYFAVIGGKEVYDKVRAYIEKEHGYFSQKELMKVIEKVNELFPKDTNRAQGRSWKISA